MIRKIFCKAEDDNQQRSKQHTEKPGRSRHLSSRRQSKRQLTRKQQLGQRLYKKVKVTQSPSSTDSSEEEESEWKKKLDEETRQACVVIENVELEVLNQEGKEGGMERSGKKHPTFPKQYKYDCYRCGKNLRTRAKLNLHLATEHKEESEIGILCKTCGKHIDFDHELELHLIFICKKSERSHKCSKCALSFISEQNLLSHPCTKDKRKPFFCTTKDCSFHGKCFKDLTEHVTRHLGVKPFLCNICGKPFSAKKDLDRHSDIHNDYESYKCKMCGEMFKTVNTLKRHTIKHKYKDRYRCEECGFTTPFNGKLKQHMLKHKQRVYKCNTCNKQLRTAKTLENHIYNRHSFNRIFTCRFCDLTFDDGLRYSSHMRKHKNNPSSQLQNSNEVPMAVSETVVPFSESNAVQMEPSVSVFNQETETTTLGGSCLTSSLLISQSMQTADLISQSLQTTDHMSDHLTLTAAAIGQEEVTIEGQNADHIMAEYAASAGSSEITVMSLDPMTMYAVLMPSSSETLTTSSTDILSITPLMSEAFTIDSETWSSPSSHSQN